METYNGWTNYATWRVNLENYSDIETDIVIDNYSNDTVYDISLMIESEMQEKVTCDNSLAESYAIAFLDDVNYYEIAAKIFIDALNDKFYKEFSFKFNEENRLIMSKSNESELIGSFSSNVTIQDVLAIIEDNEIKELCFDNDISYDTNKITGYKTISTIINNQLEKATFDEITIQDVLDFIEEHNLKG